MAEVYRVGIAVAMSTTGMQALGTIGRELFGLGRQARALESDLKHVRIAAIGAMDVIGGTAILRGLGTAVKHGAELVQQQNRMKQAGMSQVEIAAATREAWLLTDTVMNHCVTKNLALVQGLRNMVGSMPSAIQLAPTAAKLQTVLSSIAGKSSEGQGPDFFRFLQLRGSLINRQAGQIDIEEARKWAHVGEAIIAAMHGHGTDVRPRDLHSFQLQAGMAGSGLDEVGLIELAPLIGQMNGGGRYGSRGGTGLSQLEKQLANTIDQKHAQELISLGLLDKHKVQIKRGGLVVAERGALKNRELPEERFIEWVDDVLSPAPKKAGRKTLQDQASMTTQLNLSATAARVLQEALRNMPELRIEAANAFKAAEIDHYPIAATPPMTVIEGFTKAWDNLLTALGSPLVNDATGALAVIDTGINDFATVLAGRPKITGSLEQIAAGIGAMSAIGGTVAIVGAAANALGLFAVGRVAASGLVTLGGPLVSMAAKPLGLFAAGGEGAIGLAGLAGGITKLLGALTKWGAVLGGAAAVEKAAHTNLLVDLARHLNRQDAVTGLHWPWQLAPPAAPSPPARAPASPAGASGKPGPIRKGSYEVPESAEGASAPLHVTLINSTIIDGQEVAHIVSQHMTRAATLPPAAGTGYDPSMTPLYPSGLIGNA